MEKQGLTSEQYIAFVNQPMLNVDNNTKDRLKQLLDIAMSTRQFEIELYWKRSKYFWLFVSLCFVAYYKTSEKDYESDFRHLENVLSVCGGYILSICWFFVNRGSKYWQENWEKHIAELSAYIGCPIFEVLKSNKNKTWDFMKSYPYSFYRINQILNVMIIAIWCFLFIHKISIIIPCWCGRVLVAIAFVVITLLVHFFSRGFVVREATDHSKSFFINNTSRL